MLIYVSSPKIHLQYAKVRWCNQCCLYCANFFLLGIYWLFKHLYFLIDLRNCILVWVSSVFCLYATKYIIFWDTACNMVLAVLSAV
jgi:hypothetical protein